VQPRSASSFNAFQRCLHPSVFGRFLDHAFTEQTCCLILWIRQTNRLPGHARFVSLNRSFIAACQALTIVGFELCSSLIRLRASSTISSSRPTGIHGLRSGLTSKSGSRSLPIGGSLRPGTAGRAYCGSSNPSGGLPGLRTFKESANGPGIERNAALPELCRDRRPRCPFFSQPSNLV
jgi:hypothetical protein